MTVSKKVESSPTAAEAECTICLSNPTKELGVLRCHHSFCYECIENWSKHENSCPLCKSRFTYIDKVLKEDSGEPAVTSSSRTRKQPTKARIKIKRRDQSDYEPSYEPFGGTDFMANFISSLVGAGRPTGISRHRLYNLPRGLEAFFGSDSPPHRRHRGGVMHAAPHSRRGPRTMMARATRTNTHTDGSAHNPIALTEDDTADFTHILSSSSRPNAPNSTEYVIDLTGDDSDDNDVIPARSSSVLPTTTSTTAAASIPNNFLPSDYDSEFDEDFLPSLVHSEDDDRSEVSSGSERSANAGGGVIELSDDDEVTPHPIPTTTSTAAATVTLPTTTTTSRRSGIMVWCLDCDTFHDKQEVFDNPDYCRSTYNTLQESDGFADIRIDLPNTRTSIVSTANTANVNSAISEESSNVTGNNTMQVQSGMEEHVSSTSTISGNIGRVSSKRVIQDDEEEEDLPWIEAHSQTQVQLPSVKDSVPCQASSSSSLECVEHDSQASSGSCGMNTEQTQSDATTTSSTSQSSQSSSTGLDYNTSTTPTTAATVRYSPRIAKRGIAQQQQQEEEVRVPAKRSRGSVSSIFG